MKTNGTALKTKAMKPSTDTAQATLRVENIEGTAKGSKTPNMLLEQDDAAIALAA